MSSSSARNENSAKLQAPGISPPAGLRDPAGEGEFSDEGSNISTCTSRYFTRSRNAIALLCMRNVRGHSYSRIRAVFFSHPIVKERSGSVGWKSRRETCL